MLPWYLRRIAAAVYGEPPTSTVDEALDYALQVTKKFPSFLCSVILIEWKSS